MFHGNYCGPYWSAGKFQTSVISDVEATDEFDETCRIHDAAYALSEDLYEADLDFYRNNIGNGLLRTGAAIAVGAQALLRGSNKPQLYNTMTNNNSLRGASTTRRTQTTSNKNTTNKRSIVPRPTAVPAAMGQVIRSRPPQIQRNGAGATIMGSDYGTNLYVSNTSSYEPCGSILLSPAYFSSSTLGNLARTYEKYRFKRVVIEYVPSVPTSTQGQLVLCSTRTVKEPFFNGATSNFLSKVLSQHNSLVTPLWQGASIEIPMNSEWSVVDPFIDMDLDDSISEEVQAYAFCDSSVTAGILLVHYEIEFRDPLFAYHSTNIPAALSNGSIGAFIDDSAVNATTDAIVLSASFITLDDGAILRMVFIPSRSVVPTGPANWGEVAKVQVSYANTSTTLTRTQHNIAMSAGTVLYGFYSSINGVISLYATLEHAKEGQITGSLNYRTATTAAGGWTFLIHNVSIGTRELVTVQ
jgi:hypothetical protein